MRKRTVHRRFPLLPLLLLFGLVFPLAGPAAAEEEAEPERFPFLPEGWTGLFNIGTRSTSIDGNENKFREDVNLLDGSIRLFDLSLRYEPERKDGDSGLFESLSLEAGGIGGEPQSFARFQARGADGLYDLKVRYRAADRFHADDGYFFRAGGDLHDLDTRRERINVDLKVRPLTGLTVRLGMEEMDRDGFSTTSRDIQREVVVLNRPMDQSATEYYLAADYRRGWAGFSLEQRARDWKNRWSMTAASASLDTYTNIERQDGDAPLTRFLFTGAPTERLRFSVAYQYMDGDNLQTVSGNWSGVDFDDLNYSTVVTNTTRNHKKWNQLETGVSWMARPDLEVGVTWDSRSWDQDGSIDYLETQTGGTEAGTYTVAGDLTGRMDTDTLGLNVRWQVSPRLSAWAAVGLENRDAEIELTGKTVATERNRYRGGLQYRPNDVWDLKLDYATGNDDDPYTRVSPTGTDRIALKISAKPLENLRLEFRLRDESRENGLAYPLSVPTDDVPPANEVSMARFDSTLWSLTAAWNEKRFDLSAGYHRIETDSDADIVFVTGSTFFPVFDFQTSLDRTGYTASTDLVTLSGRVRILDRLTGGAVASRLSNTGTFPVDRNRYGVDLRYEMRSGLFFRAEADRYELEEQNPYAGNPLAPTPGINNYDADLLTFAVGYRF